MIKKNGITFDNRDLLATTYGGLAMGITLDIFVENKKNSKGFLNFKRKKKRLKKYKQ